jgi:hypothetical protein
MSTLTCPSCGQSDYTRASIVRDRGTRVSSTEGTGYTFSPTGQVDETIFFANTTSQDQIAQAMDYRGATTKASQFWTLLYIFSLMGALWFVMNVVMFLFGLLASRDLEWTIWNSRGLAWSQSGIVALISVSISAFSFIMMKREDRANNEAIQLVERYLRESWYCNRCGHMWRMSSGVPLVNQNKD